MTVIKERQAFIDLKLEQHKGIADVHQYQHRLKWLMRYHRLLTDLEAAEIKRLVGE